jgi:hypothetical protein
MKKKSVMEYIIFSLKYETFFPKKKKRHDFVIRFPDFGRLSERGNNEDEDGVEQWWNDTGSGKPKYRGKILPDFMLSSVNPLRIVLGLNSVLRRNGSRTSSVEFIHIALTT